MLSGVAAIAVAFLVCAPLVPAIAEAATPVRSVIGRDDATGIGGSPRDVAVDIGLHRAYVANSGSGTVSVIDTQTDAVLTVIPNDPVNGIGNDPIYIAVDSAVHEAYVVNHIDATVSVIDTTSNRVIHVIPRDEAVGIHKNPFGIGIDSTTHRAYVSNYEDGTVSVIDTTSHAVVKVLRVPPHADPLKVAVDVTAHRAYITNTLSGSIAVIDTASDAVLAPITGIGDHPEGIAVDTLRHKIYVTQQSSSTVSVVDPAAGKVTKVLPFAPAGGVGIGTYPIRIAFDPTSLTAYVSNSGDGTVSVIDTVSDVVTEVIPHDDSTGIGSQPNGIAIDPVMQRAYVANSDSDSVSVIGIQPNSAVARIGGADRYAVSAAISADTFASGVTSVYIASGENFPDALSAAAVAGIEKSPVLLVTRDSVPAVIAAELRRLKPKGIVIMGGPNAIGVAVATELGRYAPTTRAGGADRYVVSAAVSAGEFADDVPVAYIASGENFPDALSGSAAAGHLRGPVLLVKKDSVPAAVAAELDRLHPREIVALGGPNSLSDATIKEVMNHTPPATPMTQITGADRYQTSAALSAETYPTGASTVYVASGQNFPDALSGSAAAIVNNAPVLLVTKDSIPDAVARELDRLNPRHIVLLGGPNAVSDAVATQLGSYIFTL